MNLSQLPLRERKAGQTRVAIVRAILPRLKERALEDVPVHEICAEVGVSAPTFFNYFASKGAALPYYVSLWSLGAQAEMSGSDPGVARIGCFFDVVADAMRAHPGALNAIIGHQQRLLRQPDIVEIPRADRLLWYGDGTPTLALAPRTVPDLIGCCVADARARGELPDDTDAAALTRALLAIFFGMPIAEPSPKRIRASLRSAVSASLRGYGAEGV